ncbi:MAG: LuxR C-terminal-related transcriptional regulator [Thermomicrobiales bacterium]|nr:LuxR C-terminal-related transcriptional regulator [Thermomicrobiales bacterium]
MSASSYRLPTSRSSTIGRTAELGTIRDFILTNPARMITLTGLGGCGKTHLALATARTLAAEFSDGIWLVELAAITDEALLETFVVAALGILPARDVSAFETLASFLRPRSALLVLDNCEHLIDSCARLSDQLLATCPTLRIMATSREPLRIAGERQVRIQPLPLPTETVADMEGIARSPAVQLFVERAQDVAADFALGPQNATTIAAICERLAGIPMAIELAAARCQVLTVEQILSRLDDGLRLLTGGNRTAQDRQQTLQATLDWSYALLSPPEQVVFQRLSVFTGGCDIQAAEAIASGTHPDTGHAAISPDDVLHILSQLVDKSLIIVDRDGPVAWYRMLEPVRQYSAWRLATSTEAEAIRAQHARYFGDLAREAEPHLSGPEQRDWLARLEREADNLRAALRWAADHDPTAALQQFVVALFPFWEAHDHLTEGQYWLTLALQATNGDRSTAGLQHRARALHAAGRLAHQQRALASAEEFHTQALALFRELDDRRGIAIALSELAMEARITRRLDRSSDLAEQSLTLSREIGDPDATAYALLEAGITWKDRGDFDRASQYLEECLAMYREQGNTRFIAIAQTMLGMVNLDSGNLSGANERLCEALSLHYSVSNRWFVIYDLQLLAAVANTSGEPRRAAQLLGLARGLGATLQEVIEPIGPVGTEAEIASARERLGKDQFEKAWADGQAMTIEQVIEGFTAQPDATANSKRVSDTPTSTLTPREREVAELLTRGFRDREIAEALHIATATVGVHVHRILAKLDVRSRWQVADALAAMNDVPDSSPPIDAHH